MEDTKCIVCGKETKEEYLQLNIDEAVVVCSQECALAYQATLPHGGKPIQHYSRITGYYQNITGWNKGKVAELGDRKRYRI